MCAQVTETNWKVLTSSCSLLTPRPSFLSQMTQNRNITLSVRAEVYICDFQFLNATSLDNTAPNAHKRIYSKLCSSLTKRQLCQLFCGTRKLRRISAGTPTLPLYVFKLYLKWKQSKNKGQTRHTQMLGVVPLSPCKEVFYTLLITVELADVHGCRQERKGACMDLNCSYAVNQQTAKASNTRTPAVLFQRLTNEHTQTH